jgi:hypothetical protein
LEQHIVERFVLVFHDQSVALCCPSCVASDMEAVFRDCLSHTATPTRTIVINEKDDTVDGKNDVYSVDDGAGEVVTGLTRGDLATFVMEAAVRALIEDISTGVALHAGAIRWNGKAVLVAGPSGSGKSSMIAWLMDRGFEYLTDEVAVLDSAGMLCGMPRALVVKPGAAEKIACLPAFEGAPSVQSGSHTILRPANTAFGTGESPCGLIVFPTFDSSATVSVTPLDAAQTAMKLVECNLNARNLPDGGFRAITALSRKAPAVAIRFGGFEHLEGAADVLARVVLDAGLEPEECRQFLSSLSAPAEPPAPKTYAIPVPTPKGQPRKLTIGMATYDDYDGVYFSLQALRLYHPEILPDTEFLVIDNHPDGPCSADLKNLEASIANYRYVPHDLWQGTTVKHVVFEQAAGEFVLCMDSHVFIVPGAIKRLLDYLSAHPDTKDLLQGPLLYDDLKSVATHFSPAWQGGMYGFWGFDDRGIDPEAPPFDIPMQGAGLFACRRAAWPGFNPLFRGFGGEEGYIHEKFRQNGGRTLCLPFLRWVHRFQRPLGVPYHNSWEDRIRNYLIGFKELGIPTTEMETHFRELLGESVASSILEGVRLELAESSRH